MPRAITLTPLIGLRSSVVSVLFSLIAKTALRSRIVIILIFVPGRTSLWACPWLTSTVSLVLHCLQATRSPSHFRCSLGLARDAKKMTCSKLISAISSHLHCVHLLGDHHRRSLVPDVARRSLYQL